MAKVNKHFGEYITDWEKRFYFIVGSYGSSKSYNTALKIVIKAATESNRKILVCRQVYRTLEKSCYNLLKEIIYGLGFDKLCKFKSSPLEISFKNGSEIIFIGLDDPVKLKSVHGISIVWMEESAECSYAAFKELNGRLRTFDQSMHIIMSTNPISKESWVYKHFFENRGLDDLKLYDEKIIKTDDTYYHHSTVDDNKFVPESYIKQLDDLLYHDPDLYRIARLGEFGQLGEKVFYNVSTENNEDVMSKVEQIHTRLRYDGIDFGFSVSYNAFIRCAVDVQQNILYCYEEFYNKDLINSELVECVKSKVDGKYHSIIGDNARPELIEEMKRKNIRITATKKGAGSILEGIQKIKSFSKVIVSSNCPECYKSLKDWTYKKDKNDVVIETKFTYDSHFSDAIRYALEDYRHAELKHGKIQRPKGW